MMAFTQVNSDPPSQSMPADADGRDSGFVHAQLCQSPLIFIRGHNQVAAIAAPQVTEPASSFGCRLPGVQHLRVHSVAALEAQILRVAAMLPGLAQEEQLLQH